MRNNWLKFKTAGKITDHFWGIYGICPNLTKEIRRLSTCHWLDLQTLGSQPITPKNLPDHCVREDVYRLLQCNIIVSSSILCHFFKESFHVSSLLLLLRGCQERVQYHTWWGVNLCANELGKIGIVKPNSLLACEMKEKWIGQEWIPVSCGIVSEILLQIRENL